MKLSAGWMWTGLLLLAASCTMTASVDPPATVAPLSTSKVVPSPANSTSPIIEKGNSSTTAAPMTTNSTTAATSHTTATTLAPNTTHVTSTTQGHVVSSVSSSTATSKVTVQTPAVNATTSSPVTSSISSVSQKTSGFDLGSFIGGIVLTLGFLAAVYFGCRFYNSKRGVRYRTIDEHEAII
ncbi:porimin [Eleutherodactylus coqui]|uniref:Porimin n=1 Tax=Eleutherodactylus coqui TaxID=57060 RepID=A0A8J6KGI0_ELECQ|nr:hypothetical protein GDO78_000050 [Eleutherodactylus coqui]